MAYYGCQEVLERPTLSEHIVMKRVPDREDVQFEGLSSTRFECHPIHHAWVPSDVPPEARPCVFFFQKRSTLMGQCVAG